MCHALLGGGEWGGVGRGGGDHICLIPVSSLITVLRGEKGVKGRGRNPYDFCNEYMAV